LADLSGQHRIEQVGQYLAAGGVVAVLVLCGWFAYLGYATAAVPVALSLPITLTTAFIFGRSRRPQSSAAPATPGPPVLPKDTSPPTPAAPQPKAKPGKKK